ncbi:MAG: ATP-dependent DNA helicase RecG [Deltaproteobacteria bacterium]|nr:ATP-dependent DNA helicase RecG [Deltaproteobacteria bacterium]
MPETLPRPEVPLSSIPIESIPGVGPQTLQKLTRLGIRTVEDALYTLPLRYEDRRFIRPLGTIRPGERALIQATILARGEVFQPRSRKKIYHVQAADPTGQLTLNWFHYRRLWMEQEFTVGRQLLLFGELKVFGGGLQMDHPEVEFLISENGLNDIPSALTSAAGEGRGLLPCYPLTEGLTQKTVRTIWRRLVERYADKAGDAVPEEILHRHFFLPLSEAFRKSHLPEGTTPFHELENGTDLARKSLVFDEFFFLELGLALKKRGLEGQPGHAFKVTHRYTKPLAARLPYRLTAAQRRVLGEIKEDMMAPRPMNRLLQGDVGSGKTIVALMAALIAIENGTQVAVLAPTEVLAGQHFLQFHPHLEALGLKTSFLTSSLGRKEREQVLAELSAGRINLLVGTHAILENQVVFHSLGLVIIDEQHRFGVIQKRTLREKGISPDTLVMTATPIPRTLSLTAYGDLTLSVLDEMPPGRAPVTTKIVTEKQRGIVFQWIAAEVSKGRQAFVVFPLIEESEKTDLQTAEKNFILLKNEIFPQFKVDLFHGRIKPKDKEAVMGKFRTGETDILVATTVVEVGIDIPNATVMVVENAERFGLSQLHQLRGRVGRGPHQGICILMAKESAGPNGEKRLGVMERTSDGFRIAEADLQIRGPGELLGTRQHGLVDFRVANLVRHQDLLETARLEAFRLADRPDFFTNPDLEKTRITLRNRWGGRLGLASIA